MPKLKNRPTESDSERFSAPTLGFIVKSLAVVGLPIAARQLRRGPRGRDLKPPGMKKEASRDHKTQFAAAMRVLKV